jgi:alpha-tubulin suppressor-like RCC1 family protein
VPELGSVVDVDAGATATCAVRADGTVACFGYLGPDVLDFGSPLIPTECPQRGGCFDEPTTIEGMRGAVAVDVGKEHACALTDDHEVFCWGGNRAGQLGDGTFEDRYVARRVDGIGSVEHLAVGRLHTCASNAMGHVLCWGDDEVGQLGSDPRLAELQACRSVDDDLYPCSSTPRRVEAISVR